MLQRVMLDGIKLPRLYIAENAEDVEIAMENGIPFIRWTKGQDALIKMLLRPTLERLFPHIKWHLVLGRKTKFRTKVEIAETEETVVPREAYDDNGCTDVRMDEDDVMYETSNITTDYRNFHNDGSNSVNIKTLDIETYVGDMSSYVNLDVLQKLRLMPAFIGDILDCIKVNVSSHTRWSEGYNKRLGIPVGRYNSSTQLPNLIILDVSSSIPRGISATMISLIDTLRTQVNADLIITASISRFYAMGDELPDPQSIRDKFGWDNEDWDFFEILKERIKGKHYGHVFSFGDNDSPYYSQMKPGTLTNTRVEHVHHYHTGKYSWIKMRQTGYARWCHMLSSQPAADFDTSWCSVINKKER